MISDNELAEWEALWRRAANTTVVPNRFRADDPLRAASHEFADTMLIAVPRLIVEVRQLRQQRDEALHELRFPHSQRDP